MEQFHSRDTSFPTRPSTSEQLMALVLEIMSNTESAQFQQHHYKPEHRAYNVRNHSFCVLQFG